MPAVAVSALQCVRVRVRGVAVRPAALDDEIGPAVEDRNLEPALAVGAEVDHLGAVPEAIEVQVLVELEQLEELVAVVTQSVDGVAGRVVARRQL
jgi:hypothetical protein